MFGPLLGILAFLVVLTVIALVGHGLWVFFAFLGRVLSGRSRRGLQKRCVYCGELTPEDSRRCQWCGRDLQSTITQELADLESLSRQLRRLGRAGAVEEQAVDDLLARADEYRRGLLGPPAAPAEAPREPPPPASPLIEPVPPAEPEITPLPEELPEELVVAHAVEEPEEPRPAAPQTPPRPPAAEPVAPPPTEPGPPRKPWTEMLEAFMEERNMRWGELIGGLLFVGGGVALAVSLRDTLQAIPYSQFFIFATVAAAVFGVGLYSHHRWKLATTSRGLLVIATLLTPLSFLVMADLPKNQGLLLTLATELVGLAVFGYLLRLAARVLLPERPWSCMFAVLGNSAAVLALAWLADPEQAGGQWLARLAGLANGGNAGWLLVPAACLPVTIFATAVGGYLYRLTEPERLDAARSGGLFTLLGTAAFAMVLAGGLLIAQGAEAVGLPMMLDFVAPAVALAAVPILAVGLTVLRGVVRDASLEGYRAAGTAIALVGAAVMLAALGLAWPRPLAVIAVGTLSAAVLATAAFRYRLPIANAGAIACASLATLFGYHCATGELLSLPYEQLGREMLRLSVSAPSGNVLGVLFLVSAAVAEWLVRHGRRRHAVVYAGGCGALALIGLSLVTWHGLDGGADTIRAMILYAVYGLVSLGFAARWGKALLSYLGLALLLAAMLWATWWLEQPLWLALLVYSTVAVLAAVGLDCRIGRLRDELEEVFVEPLIKTALAASIPVLPLLLIVPLETTLATACCLFWLAAIWLVLSWAARSPILLIASQAVLTLAVLVATTAWLEGREWFAGLPRGLLDPQTLQAYGVGLALIGLGWIVTRIAADRFRAARAWLNPGWPTLDQIVQHTVIVAQLLLLVVCLAPGCLCEFTSAVVDTQATADLVLEATGPGGWLLLGLLAVGLVLSLRQRWGDAELLGSLLVAISAACLIAGRFSAELATASALRWTLAVCLIVCSAAVCARQHLAQWFRRLGARLDLSPGAPQLARGVLVAGCVVPVLAVTVLAALQELVGTTPSGPAAGTFFEQIGPNSSYLVPLVLVTAALVAYALREGSAGYAFAAGLAVELAVVLGYALAVSTAGWPTTGTEFVVTMIQLATITAAVWAGLWLVGRRWVDVWREGPRSTSARILMNLQLAMGVAGNLLLLGPALVQLMFVAQRAGTGWTVAAGSPLGWVALVSVAAAVVYRGIQQGSRIQPDAVGLLGMAALGLLACTIQAYLPDWGYRSLMLGWALYSLIIVMTTWWVATIRTLPEAEGPPQALLRAAAVWVRVAGILAVLLGLKAAFFDHEQLWAAVAVALASIAGATMGVWRRQEGWAFSAALGTNLAASLAVWHFQRELGFAEWWVGLVQANVIASSAVALVWLAARRRLFQLREVSLGGSPLLAVQVSLAVLGNVVLLAVPVTQIILSAALLPDWMAQLSGPAGWAALLLAAAVGGWFALRISPGNLLHVLCGLALGTAVLLACHTVDYRQPWLSYHVLVTGTAATGLAVVAAGCFGQDLRVAWPPGGGRSKHFEFTGRQIFNPDILCTWVTAIGLLVVILAMLWCVEDPDSPWSSGRAILAVSVMAGVLAVRQQLPVYVYISGLLACVVGTIAWIVWGPHTPATLVETNVLCLAIGSGVWGLIGYVCRDGEGALRLGDLRLPFSHLGSLAASVLLAALVAVIVLFDVLELDHPPVGTLAWLSLAATATAVLILIWDRSARLTLPGLYLLGLTAVGMGLDARGLLWRPLCWTAAIELAGFVLAAALLGRWLPRLQPLWQTLRVPEDKAKEPADWFSLTQQILTVAVALLGGWVAIDFAFDGNAFPMFVWLSGRMAGPIIAVTLLAAALLMADQAKETALTDWQQAAILLGGVTLGCLGWAWLDAEGPAGLTPWLHRSVVLMAAATVMTLVAGVGLPRLLPAGSDWVRSCRRVVPLLGGLAGVMLAVVLAQETFLLLDSGRTPMAPWAEIVVAAALVGLAAGCLCFAAVPGWDPLRGSDRQRTLYVYAAEVLLVLLCLHVRIAYPELFREIFRRYWMFILMAVSFAGAGLSELFERRRMPVLSEPLARTALLIPLAPAVGFWFMANPSPAAWFLMSLFYGFFATSKRSALLGGLAILTANIGLWVMWHRWELNFFDHPQLWLIPAALCVLVAEYLHHGRLTNAQSAGLRYVALSVIYISSTTEFLRGLGESPWLPLVLIGLSLAGVLAGILLRVRSFLYLGVTFLAVVIVRMILYAAFEQGHLWVFWSACVVLGAAIIALFAVFEKRRNDILAAVRQFKDWEP